LLRTSAKLRLARRRHQDAVYRTGTFIGRLTRKRVCALYIDGVEKPSDYDGVLFTLLDDGGAWRLQLARELKAAGFNVDMNLAL
jgi:predicted nucleotide-binding protein